MPLQEGSSETVIGKNIAELIKAGHPQKQAVAIAYHKANDAEPGMGAGIMFVTPQGKSLFLKRKGKDDPNAGEWCMPGGMAEDGEAPEDTAARETFEETGGLPHGPRHLVYCTTTPTGKGWHTFAQQITDEFEPKLSHEHSAHSWAPLDKPPEPLEGGTRAMLDALASTQNGQAHDSALAFDDASVRSYDANGSLIISNTHISKANVCGYWGREINEVMKDAPGWVLVEPERLYQLLRDPDELKKAAPTFNDLPLLDIHIASTAVSFPQEHVIGSTARNAEFNEPYLDVGLVIWPGHAIRGIESEYKKELSSSYRYRADMTAGNYQGVKYDGVMRDIVGNHVALIKEGRAGSDVVVGDAAIPQLKEMLMSKSVLSQKAAFCAGALAVYLRPKLANDAKIDLPPFLVGLTAKNFAEKQPGVIVAITKALDGKLAKDANLDDMPNVMDAVKDSPVEDAEPIATEPNSGAPLKTEDDEEEDDDKARAFLKGKLSKDDMSAYDALCAEPVKDAEPKEPEVTKAAMDEAIKAVEKTTIARQIAIRDAEKAVRPYIGELAVACDSAVSVYQTALAAMGVSDAKEIGDLTALKAVLKAQPVPGSKKVSEPNLAHDAAAVDSFSKMFPDAARISVYG